jgi:hypothetical protein
MIRYIKGLDEIDPSTFLTISNGAESEASHVLSIRAVPFGIVNPYVRRVIDHDTARLLVEFAPFLYGADSPGSLQ